MARPAKAAAVLIALFALALFASGTFAQSPDDDASKRPRHPAPAQKPDLASQKDHRFLFVVDTSASMRADAASVRQSVVDLLKSDIQGQLREGDTIGLWNYDEDIHTEFPMHIWTQGASALISERVAAYLTGRQYRKKARLDKVLPYVQELIANSHVITLIFVYDGSQPMSGTPFDADINDLQKQFLKDVRSSGLPFVTIIAARDGKPVEYTVNIPGAVTVPKTAEPIKPPETNTPPVELTIASNPPPPAPAQPPPPTHFAIVMSGHKNHTNSPPDAAQTNALAPLPTTPLTVVPQTNTPAPDSNTTASSPAATAPPAQSVQNVAQQPAPPPAQIADTSVPSSQPAQQPPPVQSQQAATVPPPATVPVPAVPSAVVTTTDGWTMIVKPQVAQASTPASQSISPPPSAPNSAANVAAAPANSSAPPPSAPASTVASVPPQTAPPTTKPDDHSESTASSPGSPADAPSGHAPAIPVAVAATTGDHIALLIIAISLLTIAVALVVFLFRRSRGGHQPSLISQSIDRAP
jgi:hypothetical protein